MKTIRRRTSRRGLTITEVVVSLAIFSGLFTLVAQWFVLAAAQQIAAAEQRSASQTAANLTEQLFALPWEELTAESGESLAARATESAPEFECTATVTEVEPDSTGLQCKRIFVRVEHRRKRIPPMELIAWRHAAEESP